MHMLLEHLAVDAGFHHHDRRRLEDADGAPANAEILELGFRGNHRHDSTGRPLAARGAGIGGSLSE